ncbi:hypothetical protein MJO29_016065 [Puccinia striiformis f. sp. tritici]|nr:hypothetical protein MJO29_016065 [Puccinia striiformis f. sp. tritici]
MVDRLTAPLSFLPLSDSLCLDQITISAFQNIPKRKALFIPSIHTPSSSECQKLIKFSFFFFGDPRLLAYYTNPSENSFKRFLDQLPLSAQQKSPQQIENSPNQINSTSPVKVKNKTLHNSAKQSAGQRNAKNPSRTALASSKLSFSLRTSHYNRHNLLLCTLVSIDHSQHSVYDISTNHAAEEGYPHLEWFLGCFDSWFSLQRQTSPALRSLSIVSSLEFLKLFWNRWAPKLSGAALLPPPPTDELFISLQDFSPLKGRKKKTQRPQKLSSLRCQANVHSDRFTECSPSEDSFTSSSGSEPDCYTTQVSAPPSPRAPPHPSLTPGPPANLFPGNAGFNARSSGLIASTEEIPVPLTRQTHLLPRLPGPKNSSTRETPIASSGSNSPSNQTLDETPPLLIYSTCPKENPAQSLKRESIKPSSACLQPRADKDLKTLSHDLENQLKELDYKRNQEDLNKIHYQSSLKHLNEIKDLKEFKHRNLDEKLKQSKSAHTKLAKQSAKVQEDLVVMESKCTSIQTKFTRDVQQIKKEGERLKTAIRQSKVEIEQLSKANEAKTAKKKELKEKLATRQTELSQKRELGKRTNPDSQPDPSSASDRHSIIQDSETPKPAPVRSHPSQRSTTSPTSPDESQNPVTRSSNNYDTATPTSTWLQSQESSPLLQGENLAATMLFHNFTPTTHPLDDAWASDPWSDTNRQNNIRETFISLPNLERSALKDPYPVLRALDTLLPPLPPSPLIDEIFNYCQEITQPPHVSLTSEWIPPVISQVSSPYGAIGQQGSPTRHPANPSTAINQSLFRFPDLTTPIPPSICGGLLAGVGSKRQEEFSRTSSSSSLSQTPGYCSTRSSPASPYAPIGTPAYLNHQRLNELPEDSSESTGDCPFRGSGQDSKGVDANFSQAGALGQNLVSRRLQSSIASIGGLSGREMAEGFFPTETIVEEGSFGLRRHHSTQSLGGNFPPEAGSLNSIFDVAPETDWPPPARSQRPPASGTALNPSAKAFTFSAARSSPVTGACPTSSVGQQRARGYSQSIIPSSDSRGARRLVLDPKAESDEQVKLRKSLHRSSWSVVVGLKADAAGPPRDPSTTRKISKSSLKEQYDHSGSSARCTSPEKSVMLGSHERISSPASKSVRVSKLTGSPSELASTSSPGQALPAEFTKAACAGLFGPIGDSKTKKSSSAESSPSISPLSTSTSDPASIPPFAAITVLQTGA